MGFSDYFYIAVFVFLIVFIIYDLIISVVNSQRIKKISRKVAVKKSIKFDIWWIVLSIFNAYLNFEQYKMALRDDKDVRLHLLAFTAWTLCGICHILMIFLDKYIYITPDGLFYKSMIKIQPKEKYKYRIDGDTLELYYKQNDTPAKYKIIKEKDELIEILDENYARYTGD
ncbi:MAG: hypothetical protein K2J47_02615 [Ruminococcus sp.]|nr:hypothetical protein [Ruminococcus sp.]MDE6788200.1 hypothetical protein [Ruminococcus sp.]